MLFLLFELGHQRYAFDVGQVAEVLPLVRIKPLLQAPAGVAGLFNYRGVPVPVVDLSELTLGRPTPSRLSTRIILADYPDASGTSHLLGLIAEHVTDTMRREPSDFAAAGVGSSQSACGARVTSDERGVIQWLDLHMLLPESLREVLFAPSGGV